MGYQVMIVLGTGAALIGFGGAAVLFFKWRIPEAVRILLRARGLYLLICFLSLSCLGAARAAAEDETGAVWADFYGTPGGWAAQEEADAAGGSSESRPAPADSVEEKGEAPEDRPETEGNLQMQSGEVRAENAETLIIAAPDEEAGADRETDVGGETDPDREAGADGAADAVLQGELRLEMSGGMPDGKGGVYYRADNCAVTGIVTVENLRPEGAGVPLAQLLIDGADCTGEAQVWTDADGAQVLTLSAAQVCALIPDDGAHEVSLSAPDGTICSLPFVLDRKPPVCTMTMDAPGAARPKLKKQGDRYYLNSACEVTFSFAEEHLDPALLVVSRGAITEGTYNSETAQVTTWPERIPLAGDTARDVLSADGVYRYAISGCDKAGNAPVTAGGDLDENGRSRHIVIDRTPPGGTLTISAGGYDLFRMDEAGTETGAAKAVSASSVLICVDADVRREHSPVRAAAKVSAHPATSIKSSTGKAYRYGEALRFAVDGKRELKVTTWTLEDLAGNKVTAKMKRTLRLDPDAPSLSVSFVSQAGGADREGRPLFRETPLLRVRAADALEGSGGSGIARVLAGTAASADDAGDPADARALFEAGGERVFLYEGTCAATAGSAEGNGLGTFLRAEDAAGNRAEARLSFSVDRTAPRAKLVYEENDALEGRFFAHARHARLTVTDRNAAPELIRADTGSARAEMGTWTMERGENGEETWTAGLTFSEEGDYEVRVKAADLAGNETESAAYEGEAAEAFTIDLTPPAVSVTDAAGEAMDGRFFSDACQAAVRVRDLHFAGANTLSLVRDGEEVPLALTWDGAAALPGSGRDGEKVPPGLAPSAEEAGSGEKTAVIDIREEGAYTLAGSVADQAGNGTEAAPVSFVVDRTPPVLSITGAHDGEASREDIRITVRVSDRWVRENCLTCLLEKEGEAITLPLLPEETEDGYSFAFGPVTEDGLYRLTATARDAAGNETEETLVFTENRAGTVFEFEQEEMCREDIREPLRPSFILHNPDEVTILTVTVNGNETAYTYEGSRLALADALTEDGVYRVGIGTRDAAGNTSIMEPVVIRIDRTPPALTVLGLKEGQASVFGSAEITLVSDDPDAGFKELTLDGEPPDGGPAALRDSVYKLSVDRAGPHTLTAQLVDGAGNVSEKYVRTFTVARGPLGFIRSHIGLFLVFLALLAAAGAAVVKIVLDGGKRQDI